MNEYEWELERGRHDLLCPILDCDRGAECVLHPCGCQKQFVAEPCPSPDLCFWRVIRLQGLAETCAVRAWMKGGRCVCDFLRKKQFWWHVPSHAPTTAWGAPMEVVPEPRNWRASRRRRLIQCPGCGIYYDNNTVRAMGLFSESEIARKGYKLLPGVRHTTTGCGKRWNLHVRNSPLPVAQILRPFWSPELKRFEYGLSDVDLFSIDMIDPSSFLLTTEQALEVIEGW